MSIILKKIFETPENENHFFGYFDVPQLSYNNKFFLSNTVNDIFNYPSPDCNYKINIFDINSNSRLVIGKTKCLNLQQGCRAQFLGPDFNNIIAYNDVENNKYVCKIIELNNLQNIKTLGFPIASISPVGDIFASIDYERLYWFRRGYSYNNIINIKKNKPIYEKESIKFINFRTEKIIKEINIEELLKYQKLETMNNSVHYIEHPLFSPDGKNIIFLHRWRLNDKGIFARLFSYNFQNDKLDLILDSGRVSHFNWLNNENIILYGAQQNLFNSIRKKKLGVSVFKLILPFYKKIIKDNFWVSKAITNDSYIKLNVNSKKGINIAAGLRSQDGHPSVFDSNKKSFFITDDYSDTDNNSSPSLYYYDLIKNTHKKILTLSSIKELDNSPLRCDLHPRLSHDGKYVSVDTLNRGYRQSYLYQILD